MTLDRVMMTLARNRLEALRRAGNVSDSHALAVAENLRSCDFAAGLLEAIERAVRLLDEPGKKSGTSYDALSDFLERACEARNLLASSLGEGET